MDTGKNLIITLRVYKGELKRDFNDPKKVTSENQPIKFPYPSKALDVFLKHARLNYTLIEAESAKEEKIDYKPTERKDPRGYDITTPIFSYKAVEVPNEVKEVIAAALKDPEKELTAEQKQIIAMQKQIDALSKGGDKTHKVADPNPKSADSIPVVVDADEDNIKTLRSEYERLRGKKPYAGWKEDVLKEKIAELKENN